MILFGPLSRAQNMADERAQIGGEGWGATEAAERLARGEAEGGSSTTKEDKIVQRPAAKAGRGDAKMRPAAPTQANFVIVPRVLANSTLRISF